MSDDDRDEARADDEFDDLLDPRDIPRGYARGFMAGITLFSTLLDAHGFAEAESIVQYCCKYHEQLLQWQSEEDDQGPPAPPSYQG